jgi:tetratricopeptide (TPR) repeat protein
VGRAHPQGWAAVSLPGLRAAALPAAVALLVLFAVVTIVRPYLFDAPPGDFETRQGDILLGDGHWDKAIERFDAALAASPGHRGAMMGKAIALLQSGRTRDAERVFGELIEHLSTSLPADDATGRGVLAGAYANRGILRDRDGRHDAALADYRRALAIDRDAVDGPGMIHRILYGNSRPSTVRARADYLETQLALPEELRLLRVPEVDARQRMHKP